MLYDSSAPSVAQVRSRILQLCQKGDHLLAYAALSGSPYDAEHHPGLWELLARQCEAAAAGDLARRAREALLSAGTLHGGQALAHTAYLIEIGDFVSATTLIEAQFGTDPQDETARIIYGKALLGTDPAKGLRLLEGLETDDLILSLRIVDALRQNSRFQAAARRLADLAERHPGEARIATRQARVQEQQGGWAEAIQSWLKIVDEIPSQRVPGLLKVAFLQKRFENTENATESAAELLTLENPTRSASELAAQIELLDMLEQERAMLAAMHRLARESARGTVSPALWEQLAASQVDAGRIGLVDWMAKLGLPIGVTAHALLEAARDYLPDLGRAARDIHAAAQIKSPEILLPAFKAMAPERARPVSGLGNILLVNATLAAGGAERQFVMLIRALLKSGLPADRISVALFSTAEERGHAHFLSELAALGVRIHDFDAISDTPMLRPEVQQVLALLPARIRADLLPLITLCQSERPMAIHGWQDRSSVAAGLAGLLTDIPRIVMSARNMEPAKRADPNLPMLRGLYRTLCAMPQVTLTVNSEAGARGYEDWLDLGRNQAKVIHNAIDGAAFPLLPQANDAQPAPLRILGVFRFAANKRPELWLRTIAALRAKSSRPIQARLVGSGPFLDRIIELCNELGLHDIEIAQNLSRPDEIYCEADILLLMSRVEGTPNVVLEEQCSGLAVTACDVGGVREALHDDGLTLPSEIGPDMAADLILDWLDTHALPNPEVRRAAILGKYDMTSLAMLTLGLYGVVEAEGEEPDA